MISVQKLVKSYGENRAVRELSFEVPAGEVLGLVGPNGAGKTTTLRSIAGVISPTFGQVQIAGHSMASEPLQAKRALGFIPDQPSLFDLLTVTEHLKFTGRLYGITDPMTVAGPLLERLDLIGREDALPTTLSRGMRQKVGIACALLPNPTAILLDEPLTGLDPMAIRTIKSLVRERAESGAAVIVSSHLLGLVEELADRILVLEKGQKVVHGSAEEIKDKAALNPDANLEDAFLRITGQNQP